MPLTKEDLEQIEKLMDQKQEKLAGMMAREFLNINEQFKRVYDEFGRVHQRFSDVDLSLEKLTRRVQNLEVAIIANREQHLRFDKRLEELYGKVDALDQKVDALDQKVDALDQKVDALDQKVDALDGRMSGVERELREIKSRIDRLSRKQEERDEHVAEEIARLTKRVEKLETAVFV